MHRLLTVIGLLLSIVVAGVQAQATTMLSGSCAFQMHGVSTSGAHDLHAHATNDGNLPVSPAAAHGDVAGACCAFSVFVVPQDLDALPAPPPLDRARAIPVSPLTSLDPDAIFKPPRHA